MATVLALPLLVERVETLFAKDGTTANVVFGWREVAKQINQGTGRANRVVFEPGDSLALGDITAANQPGRNPRPIATLGELATVYVWAVDSTAPNDELKQYTAARLLFDAVVRAIHLCAVGHSTVADRIGYRITKPRWVRDNPERAFGAEIAFTLALDAMIPDEPWTEPTAGTIDASIGVKDTFPSGDYDPNPGPVVATGA